MPERHDLEVRDLVVRFGGIVAVDHVSLTATEGRITGLIGPNGAGKTTTFNSCCGLVQPTEGTISFAGADITHHAPQQRARAGLGRTFQRMELFDSLTVYENVALGLEAGLVGASPWRHLVSSKSERARVARAARDALEQCGITELARRYVVELSTGQKRLVELARVVAGGFRLLLLDEPSSGLHHDESRRFGKVLRSLVEKTQVGILLVEHDMDLVMDVCEYIFVLDFGKLLFQGTPGEVQDSEVVRAAYLGTAA